MPTSLDDSYFGQRIKQLEDKVNPGSGRAHLAVTIGVATLGVISQVVAIVWIAGSAKAAIDGRLDRADKDLSHLEDRVERLENDRLPGIERFGGLERQIALLTAEVASLRAAVEAAKSR